MRAAILYIFTNIGVYRKLVAEIDVLEANGRLSPPCKYNEIKDLPYLTVTQEMLRIYHPKCTVFQK
jgi:hypothetical protein